MSNQGFNLLHSEFGWLWTHPSVYPRLYKRSGGQLEVVKGVGVRDLQTGVVRNFSRETATDSFVENELWELAGVSGGSGGVGMEQREKRGERASQRER